MGRGEEGRIKDGRGEEDRGGEERTGGREFVLCPRKKKSKFGAYDN